jgi:hypothetical protein
VSSKDRFDRVESLGGRTSTFNAHALWPIRLDIFAVLMKNGCLTKLTLLRSMKRSTFRSAFFSPRVLIVLLLCAAAAGVTSSGTLLALSQHEVPGRAQRTLTLQERVSYQRAMEEVYWRHRIWPKERLDPKPSLDAVISQAQLEKKVKSYLRNSEALEDDWQRPITAEQLQTEMDRMAQNTRQPEVLQELFEALGNDPSVIAECLARPMLAERLLAHPEFERVKQQSRTFNPTVAAGANYTLPAISDPSSGCVGDTWTPTNLTGGPRRPSESHGSVDWQRNDRLGRRRGKFSPDKHRRTV